MLSKTPRDVADDVGLSSHSALLSELNRRITVNKLNPRDGERTPTFFLEIQIK